MSVCTLLSSSVALALPPSLGAGGATPRTPAHHHSVQATATRSEQHGSSHGLHRRSHRRQRQCVTVSSAVTSRRPAPPRGPTSRRALCAAAAVPRGAALCPARPHGRTDPDNHLLGRSARRINVHYASHRVARVTLSKRRGPPPRPCCLPGACRPCGAGLLSSLAG